MKIAVDYDGTYTEDPALWKTFIQTAQALGHEVFIVTMRYEEEQIRHDVPCPVFYTARQAKRRFMENMGHGDIQIWVDDIPEFILHSSQEALWPSEVSDEYQCQTIDCDLPTRQKHEAHCVVCQRAMRRAE